MVCTSGEGLESGRIYYEDYGVIFATVGSLLSMALAWGEVPAAVVEEVSGASAGVEFMDYVPPEK